MPTSIRSASPESPILWTHNSSEPPWYGTRMPGGVTGNAREGLPMSIKEGLCNTSQTAYSTTYAVSRRPRAEGRRPPRRPNRRPSLPIIGGQIRQTRVTWSPFPPSSRRAYNSAAEPSLQAPSAASHDTWRNRYDDRIKPTPRQDVLWSNPSQHVQRLDAHLEGEADRRRRCVDAI